MKKFVLSFVLPLALIGCATTSTEQIDQTLQTGKAPTPPQQSSVQPETQEPVPGNKIEIQRYVSPDIKEARVGKPAPQTRSAWGGVFNVPRGLKPPTAETSTKKTSATRTPPPDTSSKPFPSYAQAKGKVAGKTQSQAKSLPSPEASDKSKPKRKPWGGLWRSNFPSPSQTDGEGTSTQHIETPPPASFDDYEEVNLGKLASGSYVYEYTNKYVQFKCRFYSIGSEFVQYTKYPSPDYVTFLVTGVDSKLHKFRVVMRKLQADAVFTLKQENEITLYGKAVSIDSHTLTVDVLNIEK